MFSSTAGYWYASSGEGRFKDIQSVREKCDLHTVMIQNVNLLWLNKIWNNCLGSQTWPKNPVKLFELVFFIFLLFVV